MIWNARKIDDYTLHRRRFVLAIVTILLSAILIVMRADEIADRGWRYRDLLALAWVYLAFYGIQRLIAEYRLMKQLYVSEESN